MVQVLNPSRMVISLAIPNGSQYFGSLLEITSSAALTVLTFQVPTIVFPESNIVLDVMIYEAVVYKNEAYLEISENWYAYGRIAVWKKNPTVISLNPQYCLSFTLCQIEILVDNFLFESEMSWININSSSHSSQFYVFPFVENRQALVTFSIPPVSAFFVSSGSLDFSLHFSDTSVQTVSIRFKPSFPEPIVDMVAPPNIAWGLPADIRVRVVNLPENLQKSQIVTLLNDQELAVDQYEVTMIDFITAFLHVSVKTEFSQSKFVKVAVKVTTALKSWYSRPFNISTYDARAHCSLPEELFQEDRGKYITMSIIWPQQSIMQQIIVSVGIVTVNLANVTSVRMLSGEWNVTGQFALPSLNIGQHFVVVKEVHSQEIIASTRIKVSSLLHPVLVNIIPSFLPQSASSVKVQIFAIRPTFLLSAIITFESCSERMVLSTESSETDSEGNFVARLEVPDLKCIGPSKVEISMNHFESYSEVYVYNASALSVINVSPSIVKSSGGSPVSVILFCGLGSVCNSMIKHRISLQIESKTVSDCSNAVFLSSSLHIMCSFVAPAIESVSPKDWSKFRCFLQKLNVFLLFLRSICCLFT